MIKIVIIDDLPIVLEGIRVLLNQIDDFKVVAEYNNGKVFLDQIQDIDYDIILTDIDMPIIDGIALTKIITTKYPNNKIIALSMYSDSKYYYEMITSGAEGFVLKQSSVIELEDAIRAIYDGQNYFSKELMHNVILGMQNIESEIVSQKKDLFDFSEKEIDLLTYICEGLTNKELAEKLFVSIKTIEKNKSILMEKTGSKNNASLIIWAIKNKIIVV